MKCFSKFQLKMASFIETARVRTTFPSFVNVAHIAKISCITWCIFSQLRVTSRFAVSSFCMDQARLIGLYTDLLCANYLHRQKRSILVALMSFIFLLTYFTLSFSCCFFARASCSQNNLLSMTQYLSPVFKSRLQVVQTKQVSWYTFWPARKTMALAGICLAQAVHTLYNLQEFHRAMWVFTVCFCFLFFVFYVPWPTWRENMHGYLSADVICSEKRAVFSRNTSVPLRKEPRGTPILGSTFVGCPSIWQKFD